MSPEFESVAEPFYTALGKTLAAWQYTETGLFALAHGLLGTQYDITSIVFFHIRSADSKLSLVERLCKEILSPNIYQTDWRNLKNDLKSYIKYRNGLAHFELSLLNDGGSVVKIAIPVVLTPHHLDILSAADGNVSGVDYEGLLAAGKEFIEGTKRLIRFSAENVPNWVTQKSLLPLSMRQMIENIERQ